MTPNRFITSIFVLALTIPTWAQESADKKVDRAEAYYNFAMGHLYAEMAGAYGGRNGEYLTKAIGHYKAAIKADPTATFLSEELSDIYMQAGKTREAVLEAEEAIKNNPEDLSSRRILGRIYTRMIGDPQTKSVNEEMLKKAIEQYTKVTQKDPKDLESWLTLGRLYKLSQNSVDAEKAYKQVLTMDANNEDALTGLALVYSDLGDTVRATELLRKVADKNPSLRTLEALSGAYEQMREYAMAAETLKKALELRPDSPEIKRALATNLLLADQADGALKLFQELFEEDPKDVGALLRISQIYRQKRDYAKAWESAKKASEIDSNNLEVRYNEVTLYEAEGKLNEAIAAMKEIIGPTPRKLVSPGERGNRIILLERLGVLYRQNDQPKQAVDTFRQIAELDPDSAPRATAQVIDTYRQSKDLAKALEEADSAVKKYPNDRTLKMVRSNVLSESGKYDQAVTELKTLLDGKSDREIHLTLAQVFEKQKNFAEVTKEIDAAEKLSESKEEKEGIYFTRGAMLEKQKNFEGAEREFRKVIEVNPKNASALNYLGYMFADRNVKLTEAHQMITKALEIDPNNGAYLDSLGWVLFRMDKLQDAEKNLKLAIERTGKDPTVYDHLGDVQFKQGKVKEAIEQWQQSLKEYETAAASERDPVEVAKVQKKLDSAKVRLAKESSKK
jgi:tetratricopeptide (TPR) repeat protein